MNSQKQLVDNNEIKAAVHNQQVSTKNVPNKRDQEFLSIMTQVLENLNVNCETLKIFYKRYFIFSLCIRKGNLRV